MPSIVKHCKVILYADDTLLYYSSNSAREVEKYVNEDLHLIWRWQNENLLYRTAPNLSSSFLAAVNV